MKSKCCYIQFYSQIAHINEIDRSQYLLNGYTTLGQPQNMVKNGMWNTVQRYQGEHRNEFLLRSPSGDVYLYENNVLKQHWQEKTKGVKSDEFVAYQNGRVRFRQRFQDIVDHKNNNRIAYHRKGLRMEIWSAKTGHLIYHGEYNEKCQKEGWGIEYDKENGNMVIEGIWSNGTLVEVIRCFNGDTMTEFKRNGKESLDPTRRIPIYMGGFYYDEDSEAFIREGKGCLIDAESGVAYRECEWKDGKEMNGLNMYDGWFNQQSKYLFLTATIPNEVYTEYLNSTINYTSEMNNLSVQVTNLTISSYCCNDVISLNLNRYRWLRSIEIGSNCFDSLETFRIDGLNRLRRLTIDRNSFTEQNESRWDIRGANNKSKSFHILNCESLESIQIGRYSFSDFAGNFELKNLPQLQSIQIGDIGNYSRNFYYCSFVIGGNNVILSL